MMKASLTFYPNEGKRSSKTGKIPLYCRVCLNAKKAETRLTVDMHGKELLKWDPMTMRLIDRNHNANRLLNKIDQKFNDFPNHFQYPVNDTCNLLAGMDGSFSWLCRCQVMS